MDSGVETCMIDPVDTFVPVPSVRYLSKKKWHSNFMIHDEIGALVSEQHDMATAAINAFS